MQNLPQTGLQGLSPERLVGPPAIEVADVTRRFGHVAALSGVSLTIPKGEFFSLLGPSGCGKTTLLRIIAGLEVPDSGCLKINGSDALSLPPHLRPVNTVFQSYALFPHLNVEENIAFGLRMKAVPRSERAARVGQAMELVRISELAHRKPSQLSGGQKQRVALARAFINEPSVLLLDEPLGALDMRLRKELQAELKALQRRLAITFVYVTHDQDEALVMSDRVAVMKNGLIEQIDTPQSLYEHPRTRFVAQFLGSCNLLSAKIVSLESSLSPNGIAVLETPAGHLRACLSPNTLAPSIGASVTLAFRPEKVRFVSLNPHASNHMSGRIEQISYVGAETRYQVHLQQGTIDVLALNGKQGYQGWRVGDAVTCRVDEAALILLTS